MNKYQNIFLIFVLFCFVGFSQGIKQEFSFDIKGTVKGKENREPISGVVVTTTSGGYSVTNTLGEFKVRAVKGDELRFESFEFETVSHKVRSSEDVDVLVQELLYLNRI